MKTFRYRITIFFVLLSLLAGPVAPAFAQDNQPGTPTDVPLEETPTVESTPVPTLATDTPLATETPTPATAEPAVPPAAEVVEIQPSISLYTDPSFLTKAETVNLSWSLEGVSLETKSLVLQISLPEGFDADKKAGSFDEVTRILSISVTDLKGSIELKVKKVNTDSIFTANLSNEKEILASTSIILPLSEQIEVNKAGGKIDILEGKVKVTFPEGALAEDVLINAGFPSADTLPEHYTSHVFELRAFTKEENKENGKQEKAEIKHFDQPLTIEVDYSDLTLTEEQEKELFLYWYNEETGDWHALESYRDPKTKTLTAKSDHFTVFDVGVNDWDSARLPTIDAFQVSEFTGAGAFSLPLEVPPGPAGFQPNLTLYYNSQVVDQATTKAQASWVGMGWSLDDGGTITMANADSFILTMNGISTRIIKEQLYGAYHLEDENFWKIEWLYNGQHNSVWLLYDTQGNGYLFENVIDPTAISGPQPYQWNLTKKANAFGQEINYAYVVEGKTANNNWVATNTYLSTITYTGGRQRVRFAVEDRTDYTQAWEDDQAAHLFSKKRLKNVYMEQDADTNGDFETIIRRYEFTYAASTHPDIIWPNITYSAGGKTLTLLSVQEFSGTGLPLPAHTFTYDNLHLTSASNGYGGGVQFTYETQPWVYSSTSSFYQRYTLACNGGSNHPGPIAEGWVGLLGTQSLTCVSEEGNGIWMWATNDGVHSYYHTNHPNFPEYNIMRPGGVYKLNYTAGIVSPGSTFDVGLYTNSGGSTDLQLVTSSGTNIYLTKNANTANLYFKATGTSRLKDMGVWLMPSFYRVTRKTITDGNAHSYEYNYTYISPSAVVNNDEVEYRGHGAVRVSNPDGTTRETTYFQDEYAKGRVNESCTYEANGERISCTDNDYTIIPLPAVDPGNVIDHAWVYQSAQVQKIYTANGSLAGGSKTVYTYESTYGNLVGVNEFDTPAGTGAPYRITTTTYYPNTANHIFSAPARQAVTNPSGTLLSEVLYYYNGSNNNAAPPTSNKLTKIHTLVNPGQYAQTDYGYDAYGNQTSLTNYTGYSNGSSTPTGAQATTSTYDAVYHTYPLTVTNALNQTTTFTYDYALGVPLTQTDPNNAVTKADYDSFGRVIGIHKPNPTSGSFETNASLTISYTASFPFTTTVTQVDTGYAVVKKYDGMGRSFQTIAGGIITDTLYDSTTVTRQSTPHTSSETVYYTTTTFDPSTRTTTVVAPDGTVTTSANNGLTSTTTDANGNSTISITDVWGRTTQMTPPTGPALAYAYDRLGNLTQVARGSSEAFNPNPGTSGLVAWWSMNEASGTRNDSHGVNHLTDVNTVASVTGVQSNAASFVTANQESLTIADNPAISTGNIDFTLVTNVYLDSTATTMIIANKGETANMTVRDYTLFYDPTSGKFSLRVGDGSTNATVSSTNSVSAGQWYTIIAWHDSVNNTLNIQVNNGVISSIAYTNGAMDTSYPLSIGSFSNGTFGLSGRVDEFSIYKRILNASERTWLYNSGNGRNYAEVNPSNPGTTGMVSWWSLNEAGGTRNDSNGTNHLTDSNMVIPTTGKQGNAAQFVLNNPGYLRISDNASVSMGAGATMTTCAWTKLSSKDPTKHQEFLVKAGNNDTWEYSLRYQGSNDRFVFFVTSNGNVSTLVAVSANSFGSPVIGQWYFVCGGYDGSNVWISVNAGTRDNQAYAGTIFDGTSDLRLGRNAHTSIFPLDGVLDEVFLSKRSLLNNELTWLYNSGNGRTYAEITPATFDVSGMVSWWSLNEASGLRNDSHGSNHLADNNAVASTTGLKGNAANFNGANPQYLSIADNPAVSTGNIDFTLVTNVYLSSTTSTMIIANKGETPNINVRDFTLFFDPASGRFSFRVGNGSTSGTVSSTTSISAAQWYTIIAWHDSVNNTLNIQVNNDTVSSVAYANGAMDTTYPLSLGAFSNGSFGLSGRVDEFAMYKRILTASERTWLYNSGNGRTYTEITAPPPTPPTPSSPVITTLTYDKTGHKLTMSDPDMGNWSYTYDALGNLKTQTDALGCVLTMSYDSLNRLTNKYSSEFNCGASVNVTYTYDAGTNGIGNRTSMTTSGSISDSWTYDKRGRILSATNQGYVTNYTYNNADMPLTMQYPGGEVVTYAYDSRLLLNSVTGDNPYVSSTTYDSAGHVDQRALGNGLTQNFDYYAWNTQASSVGQGGRLQNVTTGALQDINYQYDAVGNIKNITDDIASEISLYNYDSLDRLTSWTLNSTTETYDYDPATGNLATKAGTNLTYGDTAHKHAATSAGSNTYTYDANGNQITRVIGADTFNLSYDAENRLVQVRKNSTTIATFKYDGDGNRVQATENGVLTKFIGGHYEVTGSQITKYYFAGTQRIAMRKYTIPSSMSVEYLLGDHLGSTSLTTDNTGAKVSEMRYKPWGEVRSHWTSSPSTTPTYSLADYTFTGQYSYMDDPSTTGTIEGFGLMFYNARMYDPALGRFTSADSIVPAGVQGYDRYAYVNNSPINYIDPTGHFTEDAIQGYLSNSCGGSDDDQAMVRCEKRASQQLKDWKSDTEWWDMISKAQAGNVLFGTINSGGNYFAFTNAFAGNGTTQLTGITSEYPTGLPRTLIDIQSGHRKGTYPGGYPSISEDIKWIGFFRSEGANIRFTLRPGYEAVGWKPSDHPFTTVLEGLNQVGLAFGGALICSGTIVGIAACGLGGWVAGDAINDALDIESTDYQYQAGPVYLNFQTNGIPNNTIYTLEHARGGY